LGERYSVVTARHEERYLPASTFSFITAFSTSSRSYETICNFVQRYNGSHFCIYDPRIYPGEGGGKANRKVEIYIEPISFSSTFSPEFTARSTKEQQKM